MTVRLLIPLLLQLSFFNAFAQPLNRDSLIAQRKASLQQVKDSLERDPNACISYFPDENPEWTKKYTVLKTYARNCAWSGTYIILNADSTFLYKHNGEGPGNYLAKGLWQITSEGLLVFKGSDFLTRSFIEEMKLYEKTRYTPQTGFSRAYKITDILTPVSRQEK